MGIILKEKQEKINVQPIVNKDTSIQFDDKMHKYYKNGVELMSVTTWLDEEFFPKFTDNKKNIYISNAITAKNKKIKRGITNPEDLRKFWYCKGRKASYNGSAAHELATMLFIASKYGKDTVNLVIKNEVKTGYEKAVVNAWKEIVKEWDIIDSEMQIGSLKYNLAGTMDLPLKHKVTGEYGIADWKAKEDLDKSYNKCKGVLKKYKDSGIVKAIAQITSYSILSGFNVKPHGMIVIKLNSNGSYEIRNAKDENIDIRKEMQTALTERSNNNPNKKYLMSIL